MVSLGDVSGAIKSGVKGTANIAGDVVSLARMIYGGVNDIRDFTNRMENQMRSMERQAKIMKSSLQNIPDTIENMSLSPSQLDTTRKSAQKLAEDKSANVEDWYTILSSAIHSYSIMSESISERTQYLSQTLAEKPKLTGMAPTHHFGPGTLYNFPLLGAVDALGFDSRHPDMYLETSPKVPGGKLRGASNKMGWAIIYAFPDTRQDYVDYLVLDSYFTTFCDELDEQAIDCEKIRPLAFYGFTKEQWESRKEAGNITVLGKIVTDAPGTAYTTPQLTPGDQYEYGKVESEENMFGIKEQSVYAVDVSNTFKPQMAEPLMADVSFWSWYWTQQTENMMEDMVDLSNIQNKVNSLRKSMNISDNIKSSIRGGTGPLGELLQPISELTGNLSGQTHMFKSLFSNPSNIIGKLQSVDQNFVSQWDSYNQENELSVELPQEIPLDLTSSSGTKALGDVTPDILKVDTPKEMTAKWNPDKYVIELEWVHSNPAQVDHFNVYHKGKEDWEKIAETGKTTYVHDKEFKIGTMNEYYVTAATDNRESAKSKTSSVPITTEKAGTVPDKPQSLSVSMQENSQDDVVISWSPPTGDTLVEGYKLFISYESGDFQPILELGPTGTKAGDTDLEPGIYTYYVVAFNKAGESNHSNEDTITIPEGLTTPSAPTGVNGTVESNTSIHLEWNKNDESEKITKYNLYKATGGSAYAKYVSMTPDQATADVFSVDISNLQQDAWHYLYVTAINSKGESDKSEVIDLALGDAGSQEEPLSVPSAPTGVSVSQTDTEEVTVSWDSNPTSEEVTDYNVYNPIENQDDQMLTTTSSTESSVAVTTDGTYDFYVRAVNNAGESSKSTTISISVSTGNSGTSVQIISDLTTNYDTSYGPQLSWSGRSTVDNTLRYDIYRRIQGGTFSLIKSNVLMTSSDSSVVDDTGGLEPGITYEYMIKEVDTSVGTESADGNIASLTTPVSTNLQL